MAFSHSSIIDHHYNDFNRELTIYFLSGGKYIYKNVPRETYEELLHAKHKSTVFNNSIKDKFEYQKIH